MKVKLEVKPRLTYGSQSTGAVRNDYKYIDNVEEVMAPTSSTPYWVVWSKAEGTNVRHCRFFDQNYIISVEIEDIEDETTVNLPEEEENIGPTWNNSMPYMQRKH